MTGVVALLAGSVVVGVLGHRPLLWLADRRVDPTVLLTGWVLSSVGLVAAALATVSLLAVPAHEHRPSGLVRLVGGCLAALSSGSTPGWREAVAAVGIATTTGVVLRLGRVVWLRTRARRARSPHLEQLRLLAAQSPPEAPLWVRDDRPLALSVGGRPGVIVLSDGLRRRLTPAAVTATLEHERAHLRGRHHLLVAIVESLAQALPLCPLLRRAPSAVEDLVELAADAQAARRCGAAAVREALCRLTGHPAPAFGLAMAGRLVQTRLTRLSGRSVGGTRRARAAGCVAVAVGSLALPAAAGLLLVDVVVTCLIA